MSASRRAVFVSGTSADLEEHREIARDALLQAGILPVVQDHFPPDYRSLIDFLRREIAGCDAVVCLVGYRLGACPGNMPGKRRSYTQLEYDLARELDKPVYVLLQNEGPSSVPTEAEEDRELQALHRQDLCDNHKCEFFDSHDEARIHLIRIAALIRDESRTAFYFLNKPPLPRAFVGREAELDALRRAVGNPTPPIGVVVGMGGQGKTTLLAQFLRTESRLPFAAVVWCTAHETKASFDAFLDEALTRLRGDGFDKRDLIDTASRTRELVSVLQEKPVLLVVDSVERWLKGWQGDPEADEDSEEARTGAVEGFDDLLLEASSLTNGSHVLLTSRALPAVLEDVEYASIPEASAPGSEERLQGLDRESGAALLSGLGVQGEDELLRETVEELAFHPLALTLLAGIVRKKYGGHLDRVDRTRVVDRQKRLTALFEEARTSLPGGESADRFIRVAAHAFGDLPLAALEFFAGEYGVPDSREMVVSLSDWNLLEWDGENETVSLHPLTKRFFAGLADPSESRNIHKRLSDWYSARPVSGNARSLEDVRDRTRAIEHAAGAQEWKQCADLAFDPVGEHHPLIQWLALWGHQTTGIELLSGFVEDISGSDRIDLLIVRAALRRQVGRLDQAIGDLDAVVAEFDGRSSDLETRELAQLGGALINRGNVKRQLYQLKSSLADFDRAWDVLGGLPEGDAVRSEHEAGLLLNRGNAHRESGEYTRGLEDFRNAAARYRDLIKAGRGDLRSALGTSLVNQGNVYSDRGLHEEAVRAFGGVIEEYERLLGEGQEELVVDLAHARLGRAIAMDGAGQHEEALSAIRDVLAEYERLEGEGREGMALHFGLAHMAAGMALIAQREWTPSLVACDLALDRFDDLRRKGLSLVDGWEAHTLINRSEVLHELGRARDAERDRRRGLDLIRSHIANDEPETRVIFLRKGASIARYLYADDPAEALATLEAAIAEAEKGVAEENATEALRLASAEAVSKLDWLEGGDHRTLLERLSAIAGEEPT